MTTPVSNYNWVCFECRLTIRQPSMSRRIPKCTACGRGCFCIGSKVGVPRKHDVARWRKLFRDCVSRKLDFEELQSKRKVRVIHSAEKRIRTLRSLDANPERQKLIARIEERIALARGGAHILPHE